MVFSLWLWPIIKSTTTKNTRQTLVISIAMRIRQCNAGCIAQQSASVASWEATRCRHWASACTTLPRRLPWSTNLLQTQNTYKTQLSASNYCTFLTAQAKHFCNPKGTLYSGHQCNKLCNNVRHHDSRGSHWLHF